jgi:hypothetical protein
VGERCAQRVVLQKLFNPLHVRRAWTHPQFAPTVNRMRYYLPATACMCASPVSLSWAELTFSLRWVTNFRKCWSSGCSHVCSRLTQLKTNALSQTWISRGGRLHDRCRQGKLPRGGATHRLFLDGVVVVCLTILCGVLGPAHRQRRRATPLRHPHQLLLGLRPRPSSARVLARAAAAGRRETLPHLRVDTEIFGEVFDASLRAPLPWNLTSSRSRVAKAGGGDTPHCARQWRCSSDGGAT